MYPSWALKNSLAETHWAVDALLKIIVSNLTTKSQKCQYISWGITEIQTGKQYLFKVPVDSTYAFNGHGICSINVLEQNRKNKVIKNLL